MLHFGTMLPDNMPSHGTLAQDKGCHQSAIRPVLLNDIFRSTKKTLQDDIIDI